MVLDIRSVGSKVTFRVATVTRGNRALFAETLGSLTVTRFGDKLDSLRARIS